MLLAALTATITAAPNPAVGYLIDYLGKLRHHTTSSYVTPHTLAPPVATYSLSSFSLPAQPPQGATTPQAAPAAPAVVPAAPTHITNVRYY